MTLSRPLARSSRIAIRIATGGAARARCFSSTVPAASGSAPSRNRVYTSVRTPGELSDLLLISSSTRRPLITLWTASWCASCKAVAPLVRRLVEADGAGEAAGGLGYVEVHVDAATIGDLPLTYRITSMPTLMAFDRGEAQFETRLTSVDRLRDAAFLHRWLETEAARRGQGGAGGGKSLLGKWFG